MKNNALKAFLSSSDIAEKPVAETKEKLKEQLKEQFQEEPTKKARNKRRIESKVCKGYKFAIAPSPEQQVLLKSWMGCTRWIWNTTLYRQNNQYDLDKSSLKTSEVSKEITQLKKTPEYDFLNKAPRTVLTMAFQHLNTSWQAFFDGKDGKRADKPNKPRYKQKDKTSVSFQVDPRQKHPLNYAKKQIYITGLGYVPINLTEEVFGDLSFITVSKQGTKWFCSLGVINVEQNKAERINLNSSRAKTIFPDNPTDLALNPDKHGLIAIDLSVTHSAVWTTNGQTSHRLLEEKHIKLTAAKERRRQKYERVQSRKLEAKYLAHGIKREKNGAWPKGAGKELKSILETKKKLAKEKLCLPNTTDNDCEKNFYEERFSKIDQLFSFKSQRLIKTEEKISQGYKKERMFREDIIHKFTTSLVLNYHTVVLETLDLHEMAQGSNRGFRKSMHEACMGEIVKQLKYKCAWYNRSLLFVDKWFPSSKRCSGCHMKHTELKRGDTEWDCKTCQQHNNRDDNATINLWQEGWRLLEITFQENNADMLAAGSAVRGAQGVIFEKEKKNTPKCLSDVPTEKTAGKNGSLKDKFLKDKNLSLTGERPTEDPRSRPR